MEVYWHDYASTSKGVSITEAGLIEKASIIGRTGLMLLECGTGAWRVRSSMNTLSRELGGHDHGGHRAVVHRIHLLRRRPVLYSGAVSDQYRGEHLPAEPAGTFRHDFDREGKFMTGEELHSHLDEIERIHGLYSPAALGLCGSTGVQLFHLPAGRRHRGDALRVRGRASATLCVQVDKTSLHPVSGHHCLGLFGQCGLCRSPESCRGAVCRLGAARGRIYLLDALYHPRVFRSSPAASTLPSWICAPGWNVWPTPSSSFWWRH